jgi:hypothetical protein
MNMQTALDRPALVEGPAPAPRNNIVPVPPPGVLKSYPPKLAKTLMAITREFGPIKKGSAKDATIGGWNDFHKYGYQRWDDVLQRESELFAKHGIILQQSEVARSLLDKLISISYEFTIINEDGDVWPDRPVWTAIGRLQDHKGIFDDKAANKCHSAAHKYFLLHTFKIKTQESVEDDADSDGRDKGEPAAAKPKPPRPGSAEAKVLNEPKMIDSKGHKPDSWAKAFVYAIERAEAADVENWVELNQPVIERIKSYDGPYGEVVNAIAARRADLAPAAPKPPRPPRPAAAAPKPAPMPDPVEDAEGFIKWLKVKLAAFEAVEDGETFWNERIEPLDLMFEVHEDAMACFRQFERRFEQ